MVVSSGQGSRSVEGPLAAADGVGAGEDVAERIAGDACGQPVGVRVRRR